MAEHTDMPDGRRASQVRLDTIWVSRSNPFLSFLVEVGLGILLTGRRRTSEYPLPIQVRRRPASLSFSTGRGLRGWLLTREDLKGAGERGRISREPQ